MAKSSVQRRLGVRAPAVVPVSPAAAPPVLPPVSAADFSPPGKPLFTGTGPSQQAVPIADVRTPPALPEQEQEGAVSRALRGFNRGASQVAIDPTYNPLVAGLIGGASAIGAERQDALARRAAALAPQQAVDLEVRKETARRQAAEPFEASQADAAHRRALELAKVKAEEARTTAAAKPPLNRAEQAAVAKAKTAANNARAFEQAFSPELDRLEELNKKSRGGYIGAGIQAASQATNIGTGSETYQATADIRNSLDGLVTRMLKATFPGAISDDERRYLREVLGSSPRMTPTDRAIAMSNIRRMLASKRVEADLALASWGEAPAEGAPQAAPAPGAPAAPPAAGAAGPKSTWRNYQ